MESQCRSIIRRPDAVCRPVPTREAESLGDRIAVVFVQSADEPAELYERFTTAVLDRFREDLDLECVEAKQLLKGQRTEWEIDALGRTRLDQIVLVECRQLRRRLTQEAIAAVAFRILDTCAAGGIVVSSNGLQSGAKKIANASKIVDAILKQVDSVPLRRRMSSRRYAIHHSDLGILSTRVSISLDVSFDVVDVTLLHFRCNSLTAGFWGATGTEIVNGIECHVAAFTFKNQKVELGRIAIYIRITFFFNIRLSPHVCSDLPWSTPEEDRSGGDSAMHFPGDTDCPS